MNTKRIIFWAGFVVVLGLIVWGLVAADNKAPSGPEVGTPAAVASDDHSRGSATSTVTMIEYSDFQCPACGAYYPLIEKVVASSTVPVRLVYRHFPLPQHKNAFIAAQASEAAAMQGKFWDMAGLLFTTQPQWSELTDPRDVFTGFAVRLGLDATRFKTDMDSQAAKDAVTRDRDEGIALGIYQTPTFFLNGKVIDNPQGYEQFKTAIEAAAR